MLSLARRHFELFNNTHTPLEKLKYISHGEYLTLKFHLPVKPPFLLPVHLPWFHHERGVPAYEDS